MTVLEAVLVGLLQGITEFLPISSSGHLVLLESTLNLSTDNFFYLTIVTHLGTLLAVLLYFRQMLWQIITGLFKKDPQSIRLTGFLILATLPVVIFGVLAGDFTEEKFSNPIFVLVAFLVTAIYFLIAEKLGSKSTLKKELNFKNSFLIGISQAIAVFPGISRSGSTLATGLLLGLDRAKSAEFSFLLAIPTILGAGIFSLKDGLPTSDINLNLFAISFVCSFAAGYFFISSLMKFYKEHTLKPFAIYLFILSLSGLVYFLK